MRQRAAAGCHLWHAHRGEPARSTGCERGRGRGSERGRTREAFAVPLYGNAQPRPLYGRNRVGPKIASSSSSLSRGIDTAARWRPQLGWAIARDASALRRVVKNSRTPEPEAPGAQKPSAPSSTCLSLPTQRRCVIALYRGITRSAYRSTMRSSQQYVRRTASFVDAAVPRCRWSSCPSRRTNNPPPVPPPPPPPLILPHVIILSVHASLDCPSQMPVRWNLPGCSGS